MPSTRLSLVSLTLPIALAGCGGGGSSNGNVAIALQVLAPAPFAPDACGNDVTSAQLVLREVELDGDAADDASETDTEEIETGPYLLELAGADFNGMIQQDFLSASLPAGTYDEVEFDIHKLDDGDPKDQAAAEADPAGLGEMLAANISVRISGSNSNGAFTFTSDLDETQEHAVNVVVGDATSGIDGITLTIDPSAWFQAVGDGSCLDPANPDHAGEIDEAIKSSIDVDEDDDADGISDEEDEDDGDDDEAS